MCGFQWALPMRISCFTFPQHTTQRWLGQFPVSDDVIIAASMWRRTAVCPLLVGLPTEHVTAHLWRRKWVPGAVRVAPLHCFQHFFTSNSIVLAFSHSSLHRIDSLVIPR
jgi:hypothetical protein